MCDFFNRESPKGITEGILFMTQKYLVLCLIIIYSLYHYYLTNHHIESKLWGVYQPLRIILKRFENFELLGVLYEKHSLMISKLIIVHELNPLFIMRIFTKQTVCDGQPVSCFQIKRSYWVCFFCAQWKFRTF